ncbi:CPBP family intramembrane metalloprotease [Polymorphobacter arshaanensis]|uniref:CPBP family intramembrane metalloprotease n=1 Tax=Glacieibacterium arshaanense TaxID=2511025 RepID=A0A4Y9EQI8_9SPHN|nr:CPBP family intramembrane glutamic endopeptidase [Polymorphobacter arshaanensis]TFU05712.1 CPBP family intramembrane metalloprotease [Polymorphobacter arshaanensis]
MAATGYIAIMAVGMFTTGHVFNITYGDPNMVRVLVFFEVAMSLFAIFMARRIFGRWDCGYGLIDWRGALWMLPNFALAAALFYAAFSTGNPQLSGFVLLIVATMVLVGFSEELVFRGILLQGALRDVSLGKAILISSVGFSLLHSVNTLAGVPIDSMFEQLGLTFIFGLAMACYALRANSLVPVMIFHMLWDAVQFLGGVFGSDFGPLINIGIVLNAVVALVLWVVDLRKRRFDAA